MSSYDLFNRETKVIAEGKFELADDPDKVPAREKFAGLLNEYQRLFKTTRRLVRLSDRNELELKDARRVAEAATTEKAAFLATMSHEIRTPMNGVIGMIDLVHETDLDADQAELLDTVRASAFSLLAIINDILDFSKIEAGKLDLENIDFDLGALVEDCATALGAQASAKGLKLFTYVEPGLPQFIVGDPGRLRQILNNLINNAIKFSEADAEALDPDQSRIVIRSELLAGSSSDAPDSGPRLKLSVIDQGIGISKGAAANLFAAFVQAESSTTRRFGGTGLGLVICRQLTLLMEGSIRVESEVGQGSEFILELPLVPAAADAAAAEKAPAADFSGQHILLVEPSAMLSQAIVDYLKVEGASLSHYGDGEVAVGAITNPELEASPPDLIIAGSACTPEMVERLNTVAMMRRGSKAAELLCLDGNSNFSSSRPKRDAAGMIWVDIAPMHRRALVQGAGAALGLIDADIFEQQVRQGGSKKRAPRNEKILVAEDNPTNQDVIRRQLKVLGFDNVTIANDGLDALAAYGKDGFDILLTDCSMPNMDGYSLAREIRACEAQAADPAASGGETAPRLPIIAITANVMADNLEECLNAGMDAAMTKPLEMDKLAASLDNWLPQQADLPLEQDPGEMPAGAQIEPIVADDDGPTERPEAEIPEGKVLPDGPLDPSVLVESFGPDRDLIVEIIQDFAEPAAGIHGEIWNALDIADAVAVGTAAHKMKSAARTVGANRLADVCLEMETAGKADDIAKVEELALEFSEAFSEAIDFINSL